MSKRALYTVAILLVWASTLGWHVKRLYFRPASDLLAEAARTIPPGTAYYAVFRGERRIGWAQTDVDTLPNATGFTLSDRFVLREPLLPGFEPMRFQVDATLGPTFTLQDFQVAAEGVPGIRQVRGEVHGDSVLELGIRGDGPARHQEIVLSEPIVVATAWTLRFAAEREVEPGAEFELPIYDPLTGTHRTMHMTVLERRTRTFPDSVTAVDGRWITAREDTVEAWHVEHDMSGITLRSWVDEDGRVFSAQVPGEIRLERTAFEFAYFGEEVPERVTLPAGQARAADSEDEEEDDGTDR
ncbi:MAG: hypothetical protein MJB57_16710 [Gemmatimonadetes bacterium]|nr:hypothetical protein [Gemmatimonadota bacterium]